MEKVKEPIKIWAKPLRNGNKALYLRRYIAGSHSKGYVYEKLDGLFLIDDKKGKDKIAKERNNNALQIATFIKCERIKEYMNGMVGIKKKALRDMALKDWMQMYAERKKAQGQSGSNAATIRNTMLHLIIYKGESVRMSQLDKAYCEGFVIYLANAMTIGFDKPKRGQHHQKKLAQGTARLYFNTFVTALNEAVREGIIAENPTRLLKKEEKKIICKNNSSRTHLSVEEVKTLINTPCKNTSVKEAFLFACFCGLRISDIKTLKWSDVKKETEGICISKKMIKTKQVVTVPLSGSALAWIPSKGNAKPEDFVFKLPSYISVNCQIKQWAKTAGLEKKTTFHTARHTFATTLLTMGADLYTTSKLLGHQNIKTTQVYAEIVNKKKIETIHLLDRI